MCVSRDDVPLPAGWPCDQRGYLGYGPVGLRLPGFTRSERLHQAQQNQRLHCFQDSDVWSGPVLLPGAAGCRRLLYGQHHRSGSGSSVSLQLVLRSHLGCPPEARPQQTRRVPVQPVDVVGDLLEAGVGGGVERGSVRYDGDLQRRAGRPLRDEHPELPGGFGCGPGDPAMTRSLQIQNDESGSSQQTTSDPSK
ncbi:uncharacterized protein LOC103475245 isoform X3 [Poecilia reticulata]|uniref:uncharacterized protein LOC103475245 isoform X3 n=1 Tax=Poecilia reticulata TaxID=8081 RepID=UPI0007E96379|nr:PREDICTED: transmembrane 4 L6 family member 19 isoform X3 [Poecilia reticulata]